MSLTWTSAESWLIHTAVGGGLLLLLALVLMRVVRQPVRRQRLGEWGLAAALLVALLSLGPSWLTLSLPTSTEEVAANAPPSLTVDAPTALAPVIVGDVDGPNFQPHEGSAVEMATVAAAEISLLERAGSWLVWIFGIGAALFLGHWVLGYIGLAWILRQATTPPAAVAELFQQMLGRRMPARLLVSRRLPVPVSCGLFRPTIVLPASLCDPPDTDKLRWVFAHELTHLERRDAWSSALFGLGQTIYFYLPWFWSLRRQVRLCQEYIADAAAIQAVGASADVPAEVAADYAEFLLSLTNSPAVPVAATGVSGNTSDLYRRVSMLLQNPVRVERRCSQLWSLFTGAVLLTAAILVGGLHLQAEASESPARIVAELDEPGIDDTNVKVPLRLLLSADEGAEGPHRIVVLDATDPVQGDLIIKKEPGQAKKFVIHRVDAQPSGWKYVALAAGDSQLEPLRKALEKLEKAGTVNPEEIRKEVLKALEAIKAAPAGDTSSTYRIEIRLHIDKDKKIHVKTTPAAQSTAPAAEKKVDSKKIKVAPPHVDVENIRKLIEKHLSQAEKSTAESVAKELEKLFLGMKLKTQSQARVVVVPGMAGTAQKMDFQTIRKLVEQLEKTPNDTKTLHELMKALGKGAMGGSGHGFFYVPQPAPPATPKPPVVPKLDVKIVPPKTPTPGSVVGSGTSADPYGIVFAGQRSHTSISGGILSGKSGQSRLGIVIDQPSSLLADQLNLPKGQGLVISDVKADSPAAKAGLKSNDILLELNKQKVPANTADFVKMLSAIKPGTIFDAVILRKGKRETVSGITLPERPTPPPAPKGTPPYTAAEAQLGLGGPGPYSAATSVSTTTLRTGERFTTRYQEGSLIISVVGTVAGGKTNVGEIIIQDGAVTNKYQNVETVPAPYRDKLNYVLEISSKGDFRTESKR